MFPDYPLTLDDLFYVLTRRFDTVKTKMQAQVGKNQT